MKRLESPLIWRGLLAALVGVIAMAWPSITVGAFVIGAFELVLAFSAGETAGERALLGLTGLISVALSVVFAIRPDVTVVRMAEVFGLFSIVAGISSLVSGLNLPSSAAERLPSPSLVTTALRRCTP